jgi:hypothetical protein
MEASGLVVSATHLDRLLEPNGFVFPISQKVGNHKKGTVSFNHGEIIMKVLKWILIVLVGLSIFFASMSLAWFAGGGKMYAEPCHSLLWCTEEEKKNG